MRKSSMKRIIIIVTLLVLVLAAAVAMHLFQPQTSLADTSAEMITLQPDTLVAAVKATGRLEAKTEVSLGFEINGAVAEALVERGQTVRAGQPLARLDTADLQLQLVQAEANLADLQAGARPEDIAAAEASRRNAQANHDKVKIGPRSEDIAAAEASLRSARANYNDLADGLDEDEITIAAANVRTAEVALQNAQTAYDKVAYADNLGETPQAAELEKATINYESALSNYKLKARGATDAQLTAAWSQVEQAQAQVDKLKHGSTLEELAMAQAQVDQAQAQLAKLKNGPTAEDVALAQNQVDQARLRLQKATLSAPMAGVVTEVNIKIGERPGAAAALLLADLSSLHIDLPVDEIDLPSVRVGQAATITLDALPGQPLTGRVTAIAPAPVPSMDGATEYEVTVMLTDSYPQAKVGMTANVGVETDRKENVLLIPSQLIQVDPLSGKTYVNKVGDKGQAIRAEVTLGVRSGAKVEVVSGLQAGDKVLAALTAAQLTDAAAGGDLFSQVRGKVQSVHESIAAPGE